jgi:hypothetical protein
MELTNQPRLLVMSPASPKTHTNRLSSSLEIFPSKKRVIGVVLDVDIAVVGKGLTLWHGPMKARARRNPLPRFNYNSLPHCYFRSERGMPSEHNNVLKSTPI